MINEAIIDSIALHAVGNRLNDGTLTLAKSTLELDDEMMTFLSSYFINSFKSGKYYSFTHPDGFESNQAYKLAAAVFDAPETLYENSVKLAEHLYDITENTKIRDGELYVAYFRECYLDGEETQALGLFKSETKENFMKIYPTSDNFVLEKEEGIPLRKIDKGCMIFNIDREQGFLVSISEGIKSGDEEYWLDNFLKLKVMDNTYAKTQVAMKVCSEFVKDVLPEEYQISRADQIDLMNRSMDYFKSHEVFDRPEFEREVFQHPEIIESFREFDAAADMPNDLTFEIEPDAVKKQSKIFKSVLKLDKNFHIYIHGDRSMIERGEENGKKYYKIFYDKEN